MSIIRSNIIGRSPLDGVPFSVVLRGNTKKKLRKLYQILLLLIILLSIIRYLIVEVILSESYLLLFLIFIPTYILLEDNFIMIEGNHGNWQVSKVKQIWRWGVVYQKVNSEKIDIDINVVSYLSNSVSLVIIKNKNSNIKIKAMNLAVKEFQGDCEIMNLHVNIRKRGIRIEDDP